MQYLGLFVAHRVRLKRNGRLHRGQADELHDVVGYHVTQGSRSIVVPAALFDADGFTDGNLHVIDIAPVPDRFKDSIGKAEGQNILDCFLAQIMIDTVNLLFVHFLQQLLVQGPRRIQIATKRLFDNHATPLMIFLFHQASRGQFLHNGAEKIRRSSEVVEIISVSGVIGIHCLQHLLQLVISALVCKFARYIEHMPLKPLLQIGIDRAVQKSL